MRRLKPTAGLGQDVHRTLYRKALAGFLDQVVQSDSRQQGHNKKRLLLSAVFKLARFNDVYDIGMAQAGKNAPLFLKESERGGVDAAPDGFKGDVTARDCVIGLIDH